MKCHTADESSDGVVFNWTRMHPDPTRRPFTDYSHAPHLHLLDCEECHDKKTEWRRYRDEFVHADWSIRTDPHTFSSDFADMSPARCARCHQPSAARDNCLTCHNYHVRDPGVFHISQPGEFPH